MADGEPLYRELDPQDRLSVLQDFGLTDARITRALEAAFSQASSVDDFYASNARGTLLYHYAVGELCHLMCTEAGWTHTEKRAQKRIVAPDQETELIIITGDPQTGIEEGDGPQPNNAKGATTRESVQGAQLTLPGVESIFPAESEYARDLWILVMRGTDDELFWEISRPVYISGDGTRIEWGPRHCGVPVTPLEREDDDSPDPDGDLDIEIKPK